MFASYIFLLTLLLPGLKGQAPCYWKTSPLAGTGATGFLNGAALNLATFSRPYGLSLLGDTLYVGDSNSFCVRALNITTSRVTTSAGVCGTSGLKDGNKSTALLGIFTNGVSAQRDPRGGVLLAVADSGNGLCRLANSTTVSTLVGGLLNPCGVFFYNTTTLLVADTWGNRVLALNPTTGARTATFGNGTAGYSDGPLASALFNKPIAAITDDGVLIYITDWFNRRVRVVNLAFGNVSTLAGDGSESLLNPVNLAFYDLRTLVVTEWGNNRITLLDTVTGALKYIAGGNLVASYAEGYGALAAFNNPMGVAVASNGTIFVADMYNNILRKLTCEPCPASYFCASGVPVQCPRGNYCPLSSQYPLPCPAGTASEALGASSATTCTACSVGSYATLGSMACTPCPYATYGAVIGLTTSACSGNCTSGTPSYGCPPGSTTPAPILCPVNSYCPGGNPAPAIPCYPASACTTPGLSSQPPCTWKVTTLAGTGAQGFSDGYGTSSIWSCPTQITLFNNTFHVLDYYNSRLRALSPQPPYLVRTLPLPLSIDPKGMVQDLDTGEFYYNGGTGNEQIRRVNPSGTNQTLFAGNGTRGHADGAALTQAMFKVPFYMALLPNKDLVLADSNNCLIRRVSGGIVTTLAGSKPGFKDGPALASQFNFPLSVAPDAAGTLYVCDCNNYLIRSISPLGIVSTLAGSRSVGLKDGAGTFASFVAPTAIAYDTPLNALYIIENGPGNSLRRVSLPGGVVTTLVGGVMGQGVLLDGYGTEAGFSYPQGLVVGPDGAITIADSASNAIRQVTCVPCPAGFHCASGVPIQCPRGSFCPLSSLDPTPCPAGSYSEALGASSSSVCKVCGVGLYSTPGSMVCTPCPAGVWGGEPGLTTPYCSGTCSAPPGFGCPPGSTSPANATLPCPIGFACPGGTPAPATPCSPATACTLPGLAIQPPCVWNLSTFSGNGTLGFANGSPQVSMFSNPAGMAIVGSTVYLADADNGLIRTLSLEGGHTGTLAGVAGNPGVIDGAGTSATLYYPLGVLHVPLWGGLVVSGIGGRLRLVALNGSVSTLSGGNAGTSDGVASVAGFFSPIQVAPTTHSTTPSTFPSFVLVADSSSARIRLVSPTGRVTTFAGSGVVGNADGPALSASFTYPAGVAQSADGNVWVSDRSGHRLRMVSTAMVVSTVVGNGSGVTLDGWGTQALTNSPEFITLDTEGAGWLYICELFGNTVRRYSTATTYVETLVGSGRMAFADGWGLQAALYGPRCLTFTPSGAALVSTGYDSQIRLLTCVPCPVNYDCSSGTPIRLSSSPTCSVSPTPSSTPSPTPSSTASQSPTPSSTASPTPTASSTVTPTITPTASNTPPPFSCLSRRTDQYPCKTPSAALFPPQLSRSAIGVSGGSTATQSSSNPFILPIAPKNATSTPTASTPPPTTLFSSWPFVTSTFSLTFPISPSLGEALSVSCIPSAPSLGTAQRDPTSTTPCTGSSASSPSCASLPSAPERNSLGPVTLNFTFQGVAPIFPSPALTNGSSTTTTTITVDSGFVTCTVVSNPLALSSSSGLPYPHYGLSTTLPPMRATLAPFSLPLLAAVLLESTTVFGSFLAVGGGAGSGGGSSGAYTTFTLPPSYTLPCDTITAYTSSSTAGEASVWRLPAVAFNCSASASALGDLAFSATQPSPASSSGGSNSGSGSGGASSRGSPSPPLTAVIGGSRHVLLVASPLTPFQPNSLRVFLGASPAVINWVLPGGALASITTPSLSALCGSLVANTTATTSPSITSPDSGSSSGSSTSSAGSGEGDCGTFPLILLNSLPQYLPIPSIYPPFQPTLDWLPLLTPSVLADPTSPLSQASTLVGLPLTTILAATDAFTPLGTGIRIVSKCIDPTAAPPEDCVVVGGRQQQQQQQRNASGSGGKVCLWGSGDVCLPCPSGALCPGGEVLLPLPGFWAPSRSSPPSELTPCPAPDALTRCPGFQAIPSPLGIYGCGVGFKGQACAACDSGYYRDSGTCTTCPRTSLVSSILLPILVFLGGLVGFGVVALAIVYTALRSWGGVGVGGEPVKLYTVAQSVAQLLLWVFLSAQGLASLFTQAQAVSPPGLIPLFKAASALQFKSIAADPSCYSSIPFLSFWLATLAVVGALLVGGVGLVAYTRLPYRGVATTALTLSTLVLTLGYGALSGIFSAACICTFSGPMTVSDYVNAKSDGRALKAALGSRTPPFSTLQAASLNPISASLSGLAPLLKTSIPVSVLTSDPYQVCGEGAHAFVRPTAIAMTLLFTAGLPALGLWLLWTVGRLKGCKRKCCPAQCGGRYKLPPAATITGERRARTIPPLPPGAAATPTNAGRRSTRPAHALLGLLLDPTLRPPLAWTGFFELGVLAVITGCVAVAAQSGLSVLAYCVAQGGVVGVSGLAIGVLSYGGKLYLPSHEWKRAIKCALYGVTGVTAVFNGVLFALQGNAFFSGGGGGKEWLSLIPLVLAGLVAILLLVSWWRSLFFAPPPTAKDPPHTHPPSITKNPMYVALVKATPWERHRDEDGDVYWYHPGSGESAWELPSGGSTFCGWVWDGEEGEWVHVPTGGGLRMVIPPPADKAQAEAIIQEYLRAMEAPKVRVVVSRGRPAAEQTSSLPPPPPPLSPPPPPPPPPSLPPPQNPNVTASEPVLSLSNLFQVVRARRGAAGGRKKGAVFASSKGSGVDEMKAMFPDITELELNYYAKAGGVTKS